MGYFAGAGKLLRDPLSAKQTEAFVGDCNFGWLSPLSVCRGSGSWQLAVEINEPLPFGGKTFGCGWVNRELFSDSP